MNAYFIIANLNDALGHVRAANRAARRANIGIKELDDAELHIKAVVSDVEFREAI